MMNQADPYFATQVRRASQQLREELLNQRNDQGHWVGELSNSALATATAISALAQYREHSLWPVLKRSRMDEMIEKGCHWLLTQQNTDGGWGDTDHSHSNIATTMLVVAALTLSGHADQPVSARAIESAHRFIDAEGRVDGLRRRFGKDKTFAVPILANCAIAGLVPWKEVAALPCEAVIVPQKFYRFVNLPVVSYAIPALVAIGQAKFIKDPPWNPITRLLRKLSKQRGINVLTRMQPASGGFLEAIPLTCFVGMSLAHTGRADYEVVQHCIKFVDQSFRDLDEYGGTWPIDTNLATWNTTLAINALGDSNASPDQFVVPLSGGMRPDASGTIPPKGGTTNKHLNDDLLNWLLSCQHNEEHPFTGAAPGGWGWSDLSGAVPDADDTPGALLALRQWMTPDSAHRQRITAAATSGIDWLLDLQNRDHGWPTFCRGWGRLPFDRSGNDISAHAIRALVAWQDDISNPRIPIAIENGFQYLEKHQNPDGTWYPLWFGNQDQEEEVNPVYGTVKVLFAWLETGRIGHSAAGRAIEWLLKNQNEDFGWGGGPSHQRHTEAPASHAVTSSVQETSLVVELLARLHQSSEFGQDDDVAAALHRGTQWLLETVISDKTAENWPIGFYFAKLWYYERLYPLVFATSALRCVSQTLNATQETPTLT